MPIGKFLHILGHVGQHSVFEASSDSKKGGAEAPPFGRECKG
jgi:hypothetical protein